MAYGKVVAYGDVPMLQVFVKHGIHIIEAVLRMFVFVELSNDDGSDMGNETSHFYVVEHAVYLAHSLASILHEKDDIIEQHGVEIRTSEIVEYRHIATNDRSFCLTSYIQRMRGYAICRQIALKHAT